MLIPTLHQQRKYLLLGFYILISITFIISKSPKININIKSVALALISPVQILINNFSKAYKNFWNSIEETRILKQELIQTREELEKLKGISVEIEEIRKENAHLRSVLENLKELKFNAVYAEIIARDPSNYYSTFVVNKGKNAGIKINMPVIAYQGKDKALVGKVIEVSKYYSKILPITGVGSFVGAMFMESRYIGVIKGMGKTADYLLLEYISRDAPVNYGDLIVTSGQGGLFPKGINIGKVVGFTKTKYGPFYKEIRVKPLIDFSKLEDVYILLQKEADEIIMFYKEGNI